MPAMRSSDVNLDAQFRGDLLIRISIGGEQDHLGALRLAHRNLASSGPPLKGRLLMLREMNLLRNAHRSLPPFPGRLSEVSL